MEQQSCFVSHNLRRKFQLAPTILTRKNSAPQPTKCLPLKGTCKLMDNKFLSKLWETKTFFSGRPREDATFGERGWHSGIRRGSRWVQWVGAQVPGPRPLGMGTSGQSTNSAPHRVTLGKFTSGASVSSSVGVITSKG